MCHVTKHVLRMRRGLVAERARSKMAADILDDDQWLYGEEGKPLARIGESLVHLPVFCFFFPQPPRLSRRNLSRSSLKTEGLC